MCILEEANRALLPVLMIWTLVITMYIFGIIVKHSVTAA